MAPNEFYEQNQITAARRLMAYFYVYVESNYMRGEGIPLFSTSKGPVLPNHAPKDEWDAHRNLLIGKDFKFTWSNLPRGAKYI